MTQITKVPSACQAISKIFDNREKIFGMASSVEKPLDVSEPSVALAAEKPSNGAGTH